MFFNIKPLFITGNEWVFVCNFITIKYFVQ
nr:MAG TPA: hypothetical protein [Caudoviricetes sp.]